MGHTQLRSLRGKVMRMKVENTPDFALTDASCKEATGKTLTDWYAEFDSIDGLKAGRKALGQHMQEQKVPAWWMGTLVVEYERHHDVRKKDGLFEGYTICVTKNISAPVAKVYAAWTNPTTQGSGLGTGITPVNVALTGSMLGGSNYQNVSAGTYTQSVAIVIAP